MGGSALYNQADIEGPRNTGADNITLRAAISKHSQGSGIANGRARVDEDLVHTGEVYFTFDIGDPSRPGLDALSLRASDPGVLCRLEGRDVQRSCSGVR